MIIPLIKRRKEVKPERQRLADLAKADDATNATAKSRRAVRLVSLPFALFDRIKERFRRI